ncbi:MAG: hypothetical protein IPH96_17185 [Saprospiraceae bacterium]|nr:hypothetical protein [Saprospiraceae bacterium]
MSQWSIRIAQFHDHNWILGQGKPYKNPKPGGSNEGLMQFNFQTGLNIRLDTNINNICYMSYTCSTISDEKGNLVAYTDGHNIVIDESSNHARWRHHQSTFLARISWIEVTL